MKLQHTVFLWSVKGDKFFRTFKIGEVDLKYFDSNYVADGAIHMDFRLNNDETAIKYFAAIIKNLLSQNYNIGFIHPHLLGIDGYSEALDILREEMSPKQ